GQDASLLIPERSSPGARASGVDVRGVRKDRTEFLMDLSYGRLDVGGESLVLAAVRDVTERKRAEHALKRSEERFEKAFRANPAAMSMSTLPEGRVLDVNDRFLAMTGWKREEVLGRTLDELRFWAGPGPEALLAERRAVEEMSFRYRTRTGALREAVGS